MSARRLGLLSAMAVVVLSGAMLAPDRMAGVAAAPDPATDDARMTYLRDCAWCHGARGEGTGRGPSLDGTGAAHTYYMVASGRMPIEDPGERSRRRPPAYPPEMVEALARYVGELAGGPDIPDVHPRRGDPGLGGQLFRINCSACHGATGVGTALVSGIEAPPVRDAGAVEIAATMVVGPTGMPVFVPPMTQHEVDSIAAYVLTMREPHSPGGLSLFFLGPTPEGFVALFIALFVLLAVAWWIGKRVRR